LSTIEGRLLLDPDIAELYEASWAGYMSKSEEKEN